MRRGRVSCAGKSSSGSPAKRGLELRHSDHGYSLIDASKNRIEGRNDLTLDEVNDQLTHTP